MSKWKFILPVAGHKTTLLIVRSTLFISFAIKLTNSSENLSEHANKEPFISVTIEQMRSLLYNRSSLFFWNRSDYCNEGQIIDKTRVDITETKQMLESAETLTITRKYKTDRKVQIIEYCAVRRCRKRNAVILI